MNTCDALADIKNSIRHERSALKYYEEQLVTTTSKTQRELLTSLLMELVKRICELENAEIALEHYEMLKTKTGPTVV